MNFRLGGLMFAAFYIGVGMMLHVIVIGTTLDPTSMLAWSLLFAWPVWVFVAILLIGFFGGLLLILGCWIFDRIDGWRNRRAVKIVLENARNMKMRPGGALYK